MIVLSLLAYASDVAVLATYGILVRGGKRRPMHWANAVGCVPIAATEIIGHVYPPLVLTLAFGVLGIVGLLTDKESLHASGPFHIYDVANDKWTEMGKPIPFPNFSQENPR